MRDVPIPRPPLVSSAITPWGDRSYSPTNRYPELAEVGARQHWVLSRAQLRAHGWDRHRVDREIAVGRWSAPAPSVVALQNGALDRAQRQWLGVLHAGPGAVLTHATACEVGGLKWTDDPQIHVLTPRGDLVAPLPGYRFHQSRRRYRDWLATSQDLPPHISIEHALLLTSERDRHLRRAIGRLAAAVQQQLTTADRLMAASVQIRKLRHGHLFRLMLGDIAGGAQSFAEIDIVRLCTGAGLQRPVRQSRRRDASGRWRYLDLEWTLPDGRVVVLEVDGSFHQRTEHWWRDKKRERDVVISGRVVLRCATVELRLDPEGVISDLRAAGVPATQPRFVSDRSA